MSERIRRPWTTEEHAEMVRLLRAGKNHLFIANALGRAPGSVNSRANATDSSGVYQGKMHFQPWSKEMRAEARLMYDAGASLQSIADAIGRSLQGVQRHFNSVPEQRTKSEPQHRIKIGPKAPALRSCLPCAGEGRSTKFMSPHAGVRICQRCRERIARSDTILTQMYGEVL